MQEYLAARLHKISAAITYCVAELLYSEGKQMQAVLSKDYPKHLQKQLSVVAVESQFLGLTATKIYAEIFSKNLADACSDTKRFRQRVLDLRDIYEKELESLKFLFLTSEEIRFYTDPNPFGERIAERFTTAAFDIDEAAKCFALGRNTACVLHLMRVLERGLRAMSASLKIQMEEPDWNKQIDKILKAMSDLEKQPNKPVGWKQKKQFYSEAAVEFRFLKDAWRNYAAHGRATYSKDKALNIMDHTKSMMNHLATRLKG